MGGCFILLENSSRRILIFNTLVHVQAVKKTGKRFRETVLGLGGGRPPAKVVIGSPVLSFVSIVLKEWWSWRKMGMMCLFFSSYINFKLSSVL